MGKFGAPDAVVDPGAPASHEVLLKQRLSLGIQRQPLLAHLSQKLEKRKKVVKHKLTMVI